MKKASRCAALTAVLVVAVALALVVAQLTSPHPPSGPMDCCSCSCAPWQILQPEVDRMQQFLNFQEVGTHTFAVQTLPPSYLLSACSKAPSHFFLFLCRRCCCHRLPWFCNRVHCPVPQSAIDLVCAAVRALVEQYVRAKRDISLAPGGLISSLITFVRIAPCIAVGGCVSVPLRFLLVPLLTSLVCVCVCVWCVWCVVCLPPGCLAHSSPSTTSRM